MSEAEQQRLWDLGDSGAFTDALKYLNSCNDVVAKEQLTAAHGGWSYNALMVVAQHDDVPEEELIRTMVMRGRSFNYINSEDRSGKTTAMKAANQGRACVLDLLLTLGADPKGCRKQVQARTVNRTACLTVLDRFEKRTTLACCLHHYDELYQTYITSMPSEITEALRTVRNLRNLHHDIIPASSVYSCVDSCSTFIRSLELHPDIAVLSPFAKILHDLHGINGDMHSISRIILSYV
jgi:hypothetical protein